MELTANINRPAMSVEGGVGYCEIGIQAEGRPGPEQTPRHISLCIDVSGSMSGNPIEHAKEGARTVVRRLNPEDYISIISFSDDADVVLDTVRYGDVGEGRIEDAIKSLSTDSRTNIEAGMRAARRSIADIGERETVAKRVILLSDGGANEGVDTAEGLGDIAREMRSEDGIAIISAGLGTGYDEEVVRAVAEASDGRWDHLTDPSNIKQLFDDAVWDAGSVLVQAPELELDLNGVEIGDIYRRRPQVKEVDVEGDGNVKRIQLPDLLERQLQELVFQVHVPGGNEGEVRTLFDATLSSMGRVVDTDSVTVEYTKYPGEFEEFESVRAKFVDAKGIHESIQGDTQRASKLFQRAQGTVNDPNAQDIIDRGQADNRRISRAGNENERRDRVSKSSNRPTNRMDDLPDKPVRKRQSGGRGRGGGNGRGRDRGRGRRT